MHAFVLFPEHPQSPSPLLLLLEGIDNLRLQDTFRNM